MQGGHELMPLLCQGKHEPKLHAWLGPGSGWSSAISLSSEPQVGSGIIIR